MTSSSNFSLLLSTDGEQCSLHRCRSVGASVQCEALEDDCHTLRFWSHEAAIWMRAAGGSSVELLLQFTWCGQEVLQLAHAASSAGCSSLQVGWTVGAVPNSLLFSLLLAHITGGSPEHSLAGLSFPNMEFTGDDLQFILVASFWLLSMPSQCSTVCLMMVLCVCVCFAW